MVVVVDTRVGATATTVSAGFARVWWLLGML
jgi:hypothetical protein